MLLENQLNTLITNPSDDIALTVQMLTYELTYRFPQAFNDAGVQSRLIPLMLQAPRGTVNMQAIVHPYISRVMSQNAAAFDPTRIGMYTVGAFSVNLQPIRTTPQNTTRDVVMSITAPANAVGDAVRYQAFVVAREQNGQYQILDGVPSYPSAPLNDADSITLQRVGDLNLDGVEEFAVSVNYRNGLNNDLFIYAVRGDEAFVLNRLDEPMRFSSIASWPTGGNSFTVTEQRRADDSYWGCVEQQGITWTWGANVFRPSADALGFTRGVSLGCQLDALGDVFALPPFEAISRIENARNTYPATDADMPLRALLVEAALHHLNGQPDLAISKASLVIQQAGAGSSRIAQAETLLAAIGRPDLSPLQVCGVMDSTAPDSVCDVSSVVMRTLTERPLLAGQDVSVQLTQRGLPVAQFFTHVELGRADRPAVGLNLGDGVWLAFAANPNDPTTLLPEPIESRMTLNNGDLSIVPARTLTEPVLNRLYASDFSGVRASLETAQDGGLTPEASFVLALAYDLSGDRNAARTTYYRLWDTAPDTVWGRLAARHLERR